MKAVSLQEQQRNQQLKQVEKRIQALRNEMEFVEILVQFWPWQNMSLKMERLEQKMLQLEQQRGLYLSPGSSNLPVIKESDRSSPGRARGIFVYPQFVPS